MIKSISNKICEICEICENNLTFESILKCIFDEYNLTMNPNQYVLIGSTVRSYLSYLYDEGKVEYEFKNNQMLWKKIE